MVSFLAICLSLVINIWPKHWWISWGKFFYRLQTVGTTILLFLCGFKLTNLYFKMVYIFLILVGESPRKLLRVNKIRIFKRFKCNLFKINTTFDVTWWDGVGRLTCTLINWYQWIYNGTVRKMTQNNPISLGISHVFIRQFHIVLGMGGYRKVWHAICDTELFSSIFMKQQNRDYIHSLGSN